MNFKKHAKVFFRNLGVSEELIIKFLNSGSYDYTNFLENEVGAQKNYYRQSLRAIPEIGHRALMLPGGNVIVTSYLDGEPVLLVQIRETGEIGFTGGACEEWVLGEECQTEPPILGAYREFHEEVGAELNMELEYYGENTSRIIYPNTDEAHGISSFYRVEIPEDEIKRFAAGGSYEGKMTLIKVSDIKKYPLFGNHAPIFEELMEEYGVK